MKAKNLVWYFLFPKQVYYHPFTPCEFITLVLTGIFKRYLRDSKSPYSYWILLSILADLNIDHRSEWCRFFFWFSIPPDSFLRPWGPFPVPKLQFVSMSSSYHTAFLLALKEDPSFCQSFRFLSLFLNGPLEQQNPQNEKFFFFCLVIIGMQVFHTNFNL